MVRFPRLHKIQREIAAANETRAQREQLVAPLTLTLRLWIHLETALMGGEAHNASMQEILRELREQVLTRCELCGSLSRIGCESPTLCRDILDEEKE